MRSMLVLLALSALVACDDDSPSRGTDPDEGLAGDARVADRGVVVPDGGPPADLGCVPATEICNGSDDDCDGQADEGLGVGEVCTREAAPCTTTGRQVCAPDGTVRCDAPDPTPGPELCDGKDNDCDGNPDEGIDVAVDPNNCGMCGRMCSLDHAQPGCDGGVCVLVSCLEGFGDANGIQADGCECPIVGPEACNATDDDCDGNIDEGLGVGDECVVEEQGCRAEGVVVCGEGGATLCSHPPIMPGPEACNGTDDDCDGTIDEDFDGDDDGFPGAEACPAAQRTDCDDANPTRNPGARDLCEDGLDQNCDGADAPCGGFSSYVRTAGIAAENGQGCQDFTGDGLPDNTFGGIGPLANGNIQAAIDEGTLSLLPTTYGLAVDQANGRFDLAILIGDFIRAGEYRIDPASYDAEGNPQALFINAEVRNGQLVAGPGNFPFSIPAGAFALAVDVEQTRIIGVLTLTPQGLTIRSGWISGIVPEVSLQAALAVLPPEIAMLVPLVLQPDVDQNGDGELDAYSACLVFESSPAIIRQAP